MPALRQKADTLTVTTTLLRRCVFPQGRMGPVRWDQREHFRIRHLAHWPLRCRRDGLQLSNSLLSASDQLGQANDWTSLGYALSVGAG